MTDFIVKCADVTEYRHSIAIPVSRGVFRTKYQRLRGDWDPRLMTGAMPMSSDLTAIAGEDYNINTLVKLDDGYGSPGIWVWDDGPHDRITLWRPPFTIDVQRAAVLVTTTIAADTSNYYNFKLLNSSDDSIISYLYTNATAVTGETPNEMTVVETVATVTRSQAIVLQVEDELAAVPITDLTIVIDYEPSA